MLFIFFNIVFVLVEYEIESDKMNIYGDIMFRVN